MNMLRNMMVRCVENILNTYVFLKSQIFDFFDILGSSGRPGTSFWQLFGRLGPHFGGPGGMLGIYCNIAALAGWAGGVPEFRPRPNWKVKWSFWPPGKQYNRLLDWDNRTEGL